MSTVPGDSVAERLASLEAKLDFLIQQTNPKLSDHEDRIRKLEAKLWLASGAALAGGGVVGTIASQLLGG